MFFFVIFCQFTAISLYVEYYTCCTAIYHFLYCSYGKRFSIREL